RPEPGRAGRLHWCRGRSKDASRSHFLRVRESLGVVERSVCDLPLDDLLRLLRLGTPFFRVVKPQVLTASDTRPDKIQHETASVRLNSGHYRPAHGEELLRQQRSNEDTSVRSSRAVSRLVPRFAIRLIPP